MTKTLVRVAATVALLAGLAAVSGCVDRAWLAEAKEKYVVKHRLKKEAPVTPGAVAEVRDNKVHPPYRDRECEGCHLPDQGSKLRGEGADFCFLCHKAEEFTRERLHGPVAVGDCSTCHFSHESPYPNHTTLALPGLCFKCHEAEYWTENGINREYTVHRPVGEGKCPDCHDPHGSSERFFLEAPQKDLCLKCHDRKQYGEGAVHGPLSIGDCLVCHQPHAARGGRLLRIADTAELCYQCHEPPAEHGPERRECVACHSPHRLATPAAEVK